MRQYIPENEGDEQTKEGTKRLIEKLDGQERDEE
jgi:hypothetical protein